MIGLIIVLLNSFIQIFTLLIIINSFMSYFLSPFHPVRAALDRFVGPLLAPIRRFVPAVQGIDFSPLVLLLIIQVLGSIVINILSSYK